MSVPGTHDPVGASGPVRVVVADDDEDVVALVRLQLEAAGVDVVGTAGDGVAAVEACRALRPDVAVIDLLLPRLPGLDAIAAIRDTSPGVAVVAVSASVGEPDRLATEGLDVPLVVKSADPGPLLHAIRRQADRDR